MYRFEKMQIAFLLFASILVLPFAAESTTAQAKKIVLIAGPIDQGHPKGTHEYQKTVLRFERDLRPIADSLNFEIETHFNGWPKDEKTLENASTIVLVSSGSDRKQSDHPFLLEGRIKTIDRLVENGCGIVMIHWSTFWPMEHRESILRWTGGYFDYQTGPKPRNWKSAIRTFRGKCEIPKLAQSHPIARGVKPFFLQEEFYYDLQFSDAAKPLLQTRLPGDDESKTIAWTQERTTRKGKTSRGFGFTGGHFYQNWDNANLRRCVENAILWSAKIELPPRGVVSKLLATGPHKIDVLDSKKINVALITGAQHPAHKWRTTSEVLIDGLQADPRIAVTQKPIEFLADPSLQDFDAIVFNYCNWKKPGLSQAAKNNFVTFLKRGGGLALIHFSNGAFHYSLPDAKDSDWPEFRNICRRAWDHSKGKSGHDAFGRFRVEVSKPDHPVFEGIESFDTVDELYFRQQGELPIEVLATAKSSVTGNQEPMAFVYDYGKGRVFQTVLGHDASSLRVPSVARMIRQAVAWTTRNPNPVQQNKEQVLLSLSEKQKALDASRGFLRVESSEALDQIPLVISCRAKLTDNSNFNILVAKNPKTNSQGKPNPLHWEFYTYAKTGELSFYIPGYQPAEIRSGFQVVDSKWHTLQCEFKSNQVRLFVDGKLVKKQTITKIAGPKTLTSRGPLTIGNLPTQQFGCKGLLDWVRLGRELDSENMNSFDESLGNWNFDRDASASSIRDHSKRNQKTEFIETQKSADYLAKWTPKSRQNERFPYENEKDEDWIDSRFSKMDTGTFFHSSIKVPGKGMIRKAIAVRSNSRQNALIFNLETLAVEAAWTGDFLALPPQRFGVLQMPSVAGNLYYRRGNSEVPVFHTVDSSKKRVEAKARLTGVLRKHADIHQHLKSDNVPDPPVFIGQVSKRSFMAKPTFGKSDSKHAFRLQLTFLESEQEIRYTLVPKSKHSNVSQIDIVRKSIVKSSRKNVYFQHDGIFYQVNLAYKCRVVSSDVGIELVVPKEESRCTIAFCPVQKSKRTEVSKENAFIAEVGLLKNRSASLPSKITQGVLGKSTGPFVVDTITLPYNNKHKALMFASGFDFLPDGRAFLCTIHGDVWLVEGIDDDLDRIVWHRFATGLYQPLGLKVIDGKAFVICRDAIWKLHDLNLDNRADLIEVFNSDLVVTGQSHGYAMSLESDPEGNFYFIKSGGSPPHGGTMLKVSKDGKKLSVFATGYRHANGLGVSPQGLVTSADNEGNWMPATRIDVVRQDGFYGHMPTHRRARPPKTYDPPLCWLPRVIDNSAGGQVWVDSNSWNQLDGCMIHLSYGRCTANVVMPQKIDGQYQAAAYKLDLPNFISGSMRGRFHPKDGHLYLCGLDGWQTAAVRDGCFQRVRRTKQPLNLPKSFRVGKGKIEIDFTDPLDEISVQQIANWKLEMWNYRWTQNYGSDHFKVSDPKEVGHDRVQLESVTLARDKKTVTLTVPNLQPVMQMNIRANLKTAKGSPIKLNLFNTIHKIPDQ